MTEKRAFKIIKGIHDRADYYALDDVSTCLDGDFSLEELKAIVYIMENKLSALMKVKIGKYLKKRRY